MIALINPLEKEDLSRLVKHYRENGDNIICSKCLRPCEHLPNTLISHILIESHIRLAFSYAAKSGIHDEGLVSDLLMSLVKSVEKAKTNLVDDNITPYILSNFREAKSQYLNDRCLIRIPLATKKRNKLKNKKIVALPEKIVARKEFSYLELKECIESLTDDFVCRKILYYLSLDHRPSEIALILNMPASNVYKYIYDLQEKYKRGFNV